MSQSTVKISTSTLKIPVDTGNYTWDFQIPTLAKIKTNLSLLSKDYYEFKNLQFTNGQFAGFKHSWDFGVNESGCKVSIQFSNKKDNFAIRIDSCIVEFFIKEISHGLKLDVALNQMDPGKDLSPWVGEEKFELVDGERQTTISPYWRDNITKLRVTFAIQCEAVGEIFHSLVSEGNRSDDILSTLSSYYMSKSLSDVEIVCGDEKFPAHKLILSCKSAVFKRMFESGMKESVEGRVTVDDISPTIFKGLLEFMYTGNTEIIKTSPKELLMLAEKYELDDLKEKCALTVKNSLSCTNALETYFFAETYRIPWLINESLEIIKTNKKTIFPTFESLQNCEVMKNMQLLYALMEM